MLFNIALESLSRYIQDLHDLEGIRFRQSELKIALFADDILLSFTNPTKALPKLKAVVEEFGSFSGFKINVEKSEILPLQLKK